MHLVVYYDSELRALHNQLDATDPNSGISGTTKTPNRRSQSMIADAWAGNLPTPLPGHPVRANALDHCVDSLHAKPSGRGNSTALPKHSQITLAENGSKNPAEYLSTASQCFSKVAHPPHFLECLSTMPILPKPMKFNGTFCQESSPEPSSPGPFLCLIGPNPA